jgi:hypothetical protein
MCKEHILEPAALAKLRIWKNDNIETMFTSDGEL